MAIRGINESLCINCKQCYDICPDDVFAIDEKGNVFVKYPEDCQSCALCAMVCPKDACQINNLRPTPLPGRKRL